MPKIKKVSTGILKTEKSAAILDAPKENKGLKDIKQTTGALPQQFKRTTIAQVLSDFGIGNKMGVYRTLDSVEYEQSLNKMDKYDLNTHAASINVFPYDKRDRLVNELVIAHKRYIASMSIPSDPKPLQNVSEEVMSILKRGR